MAKIFLINIVYNDMKEPIGEPDTQKISVASSHLQADWRNAVWVDGNVVRTAGWNEDGTMFDDRLIVNGVVTSHRKLGQLVRSPEWPDQ